MNRKSALLTLALALSPLPAIAQEAPSDEAIRAWVQQNPEIILQSINKYLAEKQAERDSLTQRALEDLIPEMVSAGDPPFVGNPDGPLELVYFIDASCGYCKKVSPHLDALAEKNPDLKIVHRWVGILGPGSELAAVVAEIVEAEHPDGYADFYSTLMHAAGPATKDGIEAILAKQFDAATADDIMVKASYGPALDSASKDIAANMSLFQRAGLDGTPALLVANAGPNGIFRGYVPEEQIQSAIDAARNAGQ